MNPHPLSAPETSPSARRGTSFQERRGCPVKHVAVVLAGVTLMLAAVFLEETLGYSFISLPVLRSDDLTPFTEVHRVVLIFPGDSHDEKAYIREWTQTSIRMRMDHRSLLVFQVVNPKMIASLRSRMAPAETGFHVWLVGIGGHLLFSTNRHVAPWEIFARIDALPGRAAETRLHNDWDAGSTSNSEDAP